MLSTGVSGLLSMQAALDTTSHNISNASTVGYNRQGVVLSENQPQFTGGSWVGTGVNVSTIRRFYDDLVSAQVRTASSAKNQWDTYSSMADQVNNMIGDSTTGLANALQNFSNAFQGVANSPSTSSERQVLLSKAQSLVNQLQSYGVQLSKIADQINSQLGSEATVVSQLASNIADLNAKIASVSTPGSGTPNDLLDQRDKCIDELATHVTVNTVKQGDGQVNIFIGNGQALVLGCNATKVVAVPNEYDPSQKKLVIQSDTGTKVDISASITGGALGGLIDFRDEVLSPAQNNVGQVAVGITSIMNNQQHAGMDLNGSSGVDLFQVGDVGVLQNSNNTGTASISAIRSDVQALTTNDYILIRTAPGWSMQNSQTGQAISMTGSGGTLDPLIADGMSVVVTGGAAVGDKFMIQPTRDAVSGMSLKIADPNLIAAAAPIIAAASSNNAGSATITTGQVVDSANPNLKSAVRIRFISPTTYTTDGGTTTNTYVSGQNLVMNGWQVQITGSPAVGDTFTVSSNNGGIGDNRNALLMANALNSSYLNGGVTSINTAVGNWIADVGVRSNQAQANATTQASVYQDATNAQQSVSGVNLDEEAANLVRYQQAYAAMTKIITTSNDLFKTLMQAFS